MVFSIAARVADAGRYPSEAVLTFVQYVFGKTMVRTMQMLTQSEAGRTDP
jgi:hypothetical protein